MELNIIIGLIVILVIVVVIKGIRINVNVLIPIPKIEVKHITDKLPSEYVPLDTLTDEQLKAFTTPGMAEKLVQEKLKSKENNNG